MKIKYKNKTGKRIIRTCQKCALLFETLEIKVRSKGEKFCSNECHKQYMKDNSIKDKKQANIYYQKKSKYGLSKDEYDKLFSDNENCKICGVHKDKAGGRYNKLVIDHCHKTNKVRGLLCDNCNKMLGHAKDNIITLKKGIEYLIENK